MMLRPYFCGYSKGIPMRTLRPRFSLARGLSFLLLCGALIVLFGGFLVGCERESEVVSSSAIEIPNAPPETNASRRARSSARPGPPLGSETEWESNQPPVGEYLPPTPVAYPYPPPVVREGEYRVHSNSHLIESGWSDGARIWFRARAYANAFGHSVHYANETLYLSGRPVGGPYQWNGNFIYADLYALTRRNGLRFESTEMVAIIFRPLVVTSRPMPP